MGALAVQLLGAEHPLAGEWLRWTAWHPELRVTALVAPARAGDTAEELHPSLFGWRGLAAQTEAGSADVTVILPDWDRAVPPDAGQQVDFRSGASGAAVLPELRGPSDLTLLAGLPPRTLAAALALEPLLQGRVVSPREPIGHRLSGEELAALRPLLRGHFSFEAWEGEGLRIPLFEGYSEHDALAAYRDTFRGHPWVRLRRDLQIPQGVEGSPACELSLRVLEREDPEIPIPLLGVTSALDPWPALAARGVAALNLSRGWPALLGLVPGA
ncbi:hypothetical protein [Deinococcus radiophilus]|uniref:Uncharacterized protein n=1 Tax=Deinococcus radiophilus TaxID=32062 RepID=A0A3S0IAI2_9DEIO|nr:hypothetical protein [Deinococcus radiophilus]RTR28294.1 hypothetical protein EJ104_05100 [Deinococcus radiophilus]